MPLTHSVPAMPVASVVDAVTTYVDKLGFSVVHLDPEGFAIVARDDVEITLWQAGDTGWRHRPVDDLADCPVRTGAEDFIAGTASCRIACESAAEVDALHDELGATGSLHPTDPGHPTDTAWGTRELAALDLDGNLLTFYVRTRPRA